MPNLFSRYNQFNALLGNLYDTGEARSISDLVFTEILHLSRTQLRLNQDRPISDAEGNILAEILQRLLQGEPVQHILGFGEFLGDRYLVNPSVLIPRRETEELVNWILREETPENTGRILDLGTGSGCIAISLKKHFPLALVRGIDSSKAALNTARMNASQILGKGHEPDFMHADMLDENLLPDSDWDIIVSNPPYVLEREKGEIRPQVLEHEPSQALFVPDLDPFLFYRPIAELALRRLSKNGRLYFEINEIFGLEMLEMLGTTGFNTVELKKDMQGKDRMIRAIKD